MLGKIITFISGLLIGGVLGFFFGTEIGKIVIQKIFEKVLGGGG